MSTYNTPLSTFTTSPTSSFTGLSTPQTTRNVNVTPSPFPSTSRRSGGQSHLLSMSSRHDIIVLDIVALSDQGSYLSGSIHIFSSPECDVFVKSCAIPCVHRNKNWLGDRYRLA